MLHDALDRAVLAGRVTPFEDHEHALAMRDDVPLEFHQLDLQPQQRVLISLVAQWRRQWR